MVAFGRALWESRRPGWEDAYVDYQGLKGLITTDPMAFDQKLRLEIEKVSLFALHRQGDIANAIGALRIQSSQQQQQQQQPSNSNNMFAHSSLTRPRSATNLIASVRDENSNTTTTVIADAYTSCAVELLHWQRFVCINAVGIRKIIKKFQKHHPTWNSGGTSGRPSEQDDDDDKHAAAAVVVLADMDSHLQQLASSVAVAAMNASLQRACRELEPSRIAVVTSPKFSYQNDDDDDDEEKEVSHRRTRQRSAWIRLHCTTALISAMANYASNMQETFLAFLSHRSMIGGQTVSHNGDDDDATSGRALRVFLHLEPESLWTMDTARLERIWAADEYRFFEGSLRSQMTDDKAWGGVDTASLTLNLLSTLLYTINYYIVAPTANHYAILLGMDGAFGATLVGASSLAAIFAAFLYSWWYTRFSFRSALLFSAFCPCLGNLLYALAISYRSMPMAMLGRLLVGFGSAEVVNRQLISACVSFDSITSASAYFVAAGASGMSIGPLMAALLDLYAGRDVNVDLHLSFTPEGGIIYDHVTSPGFVTAVLWFLQGLALMYFFTEPTRINAESDGAEDEPNSQRSSDNSMDERVKVTLESAGVSLTEKETLPLIAQANGDSQSETSWGKMGSELRKMRRLVFGNMALPVTLLIFCFIELADEVLISSCSMVARRYFSWHGSTAGFILAGLGALVLPAHFVVEKAAHHFEERSIINYSLLFLLLCLLAILNYEGLIFDFIGTAITAVAPLEERHDDDGAEVVANKTDIAIRGKDMIHILNHEHEVPYDWGLGRPVYLIFLSAIFLGTIILEGVDTSVMAKVTPPALNGAFINSGLLATLIGTIGRVLGDSIITLSALVDKDIFTDFVNATFFPMIPMVLVGLFLVKRYYHLLV